MTLRDKLAALTAPCREVDAEIAEMFGWQKTDLPFTNINGATEVTIMWLPPDCDDESRGYLESAIRDDCALRGFSDWGDHPRYTKSLDAVVELVEREMPGKNWSVVRYENNATITTIGDGDRVIADGKHTLPAVALLLAMLDAKEA